MKSNKVFCVYGPNGQAIRFTKTSTRKDARNEFAKESGTKWGHLWELGYRCRRFTSNQIKPLTY